MKRLVTALGLFISALAISQTPIEKSIGEFSELKVYDLIEVELVKAKENKVVISGENSSSVLINNKNGTLKIKMKLKEIFDGNNTKVKLYYTALELIDANEGSFVHSKDKIKQFEIDLKAQEGAKIDVKLNVSYANIKSVTGGVIAATGKSKNQNISLLTGGIYKGESLKTSNTEVAIRAAGEAHVNASKKVDVKIRAGGDVFIYGNPENINESKVFGGRVKRME
ncbi:head GIN domain-containing protein [Gelatiniphilus marinus]|uniref:Head GIN domain-containing protein n=1 Tax=Gelatiniphilus marinus TaxID=1759464 RepID=A0ABW5JUZ2_9FLAO